MRSASQWQIDDSDARAGDVLGARLAPPAAEARSESLVLHRSVTPECAREYLTTVTQRRLKASERSLPGAAATWGAGSPC